MKTEHLIVPVLGLTLVLCGCTSLARHHSKLMMDAADLENVTATVSIDLGWSYGTGPRLELSKDDLDKLRTVKRGRGRFRVEGPASHASLIDDLGRIGATTLFQTEKELGVESKLEQTIVLVPIAEEPWPSSFATTFEVPPNTLTVPVLFDERVRTLPDFLKNENLVTNGAVGHEYFEVSLMSGSGNLRIAVDTEVELRSNVTVRGKSWTRWYRDGFASWAAGVWLENLATAAAVPPNERPEIMFKEGTERSLAKVGGRLFRWSQFATGDTEPFYEASLGLFDALERDFGRDRIRDWNLAIAKSTNEFKTRDELFNAAEEVFGEDLRKYVTR
ncbi:MAG: hypothetical protein AAF585_29265 [Verrucomicrobiota bacterium]